jgi:(2R)-3-sulfolactate dehydrogenase (NADP+)
MGVSVKHRLDLDAARALVSRALERAGADEVQAQATACALVAAEADGQAGHGLSRTPSYALQVRCGKVDGRARPQLAKVAEAAVRIDGGRGFAYPALDLAIETLPELARKAGVACAAVHRSHHFGQAGAHAERLAAQGLVALVFGNSPKAMAFYGGRTPRLGTNPIAFACPLPDGEPPLVIDLALSQAARGKIVAAQQKGESIPEGWAVDAQGKPTTDPTAALGGAMLAIGGAKGSALALMVEILAAALCGASFGWEASSFFDDKGGAPDMGQTLLALDPDALSGGAFLERMGVLLQAMGEEPDVRLPGLKRLDARRRAARDGLTVAPGLYDQIQALAEG